MEQESLFPCLEVLECDVPLDQTACLDPLSLNLYAVDNHCVLLLLWPVEFTFLLSHLAESCDHNDKFHVLLPYHRPEAINGIRHWTLGRNENLVTEA